MYTAIKCTVVLPTPAETHFSPPNKNVFTPEETLRVTCDANYWIDSPAINEVVTTCDYFGKWTIRPVCQGKIKTNKKNLNLQQIVLSVYGLLTHHDDNLALKIDFFLFF